MLGKGQLAQRSRGIKAFSVVTDGTGRHQHKNKRQDARKVGKGQSADTVITLELYLFPTE